MLSVPATNGPDGQLFLHATTVVIDRRALVLAGPSGAGKSTLALRMMALGARLLADDITWLGVADGRLEARCPPTLINKIEARGIGILNAITCSPAPVAAIVDLGVDEPERLPPHRSFELLGCDVPILHKPATSYLPELLIHYVNHGRTA